MTWARANAVPLRLIDLRDKSDQVKGPVAGAQLIAGVTLAERLKNLKAELLASTAKGLTKKLEK